MDIEQKAESEEFWSTLELWVNFDCTESFWTSTFAIKFATNQTKPLYSNVFLNFNYKERRPKYVWVKQWLKSEWVSIHVAKYNTIKRALIESKNWDLRCNIAHSCLFALPFIPILARLHHNKVVCATNVLTFFRKKLLQYIPPAAVLEHQMSTKALKFVIKSIII